MVRHSFNRTLLVLALGLSAGCGGMETSSPLDSGANAESSAVETAPEGFSSPSQYFIQHEDVQVLALLRSDSSRGIWLTGLTIDDKVCGANIPAVQFRVQGSSPKTFHVVCGKKTSPIMPPVFLRHDPQVRVCQDRCSPWWPIHYIGPASPPGNLE